MHFYEKKNFLLNFFLSVAFVCYAIFILSNICAVASGSDSSGYLNNAKLILAGKLHAKQRVIEEISEADISTESYAYVPLGFVPSKNAEMIPTYPFGLSLLMVLVSFFAGLDQSAPIVILLHSLASIILIYHFALFLKLEKKWAVIAAILLAINPLFIAHSIQLMSDVPSLFWCGLTVLASLKNEEKKWAIIAGIAAGISVLIRPVNILIFIPLLMSFGKNWRGLIYCGFAGLPFAILLLFLNYNLYGHFITTGYGDLSGLFSLHFVPLTLQAYKKYLLWELTPFVLLVFGIFLPKFWQKLADKKSTLFVLVLWILSFLGFYSFYYFTHALWWYLRFVLPIFPALIVIMILVLRDFYHSLPKFREEILAFFVIFSLFWQYAMVQSLCVLAVEEACVEISDWAKSNLPQNAIIFAMRDSGSLFYYTDFTFVRYDLISAKQKEKIIQTAQKLHRPIYSMDNPNQLNMALPNNLKNEWEEIRNKNQTMIWHLKI